MYSSTILAYSEESYIDDIAFINAVTIPIVPIINILQLKMHYNLRYNGVEKKAYFGGLAYIVALASGCCMNEKYLKKYGDAKHRSVRPKILKSNSAYGIILTSKLLSETLLQDEGDLNCTLLLSDSIIYPVSTGGNLKLSIALKNRDSEDNLVHLESVYGKEEDSWFETLCMSTETKELKKENKVVSVFSRIVLINICMELSDFDESSQLENISEYRSTTVSGEGLGKFLAINMDNNNSKTYQINICNLQDRYFELYNSHETSIESALQDYIVNSHLINTTATNKFMDIFYITHLSIASGVINIIISHFVDYASFYFLIGSCSICLNQVQYPGVPACAYHWFCALCLERARSNHPRYCPLCGV